MASGREQYLQALASLSDLTRAQAERVAALLAKQGEVQSAQVGRVAEDLVRRTQKNREIMTRLVQREVKRQLGVLGMATRDEVARLQQRVRALEQELERASKATASKRPRPEPPRRPQAPAGLHPDLQVQVDDLGRRGPSLDPTRTAGASSRSTAVAQHPPEEELGRARSGSADQAPAGRVRQAQAPRVRLLRHRVRNDLADGRASPTRRGAGAIGRADRGGRRSAVHSPGAEPPTHPCAPAHASRPAHVSWCAPQPCRARPHSRCATQPCLACRPILAALSPLQEVS